MSVSHSPHKNPGEKSWFIRTPELTQDGFVEARLLHIQDGRRRRTVYFISPSGIQVVRAA
ncbi:MAG: hypothetical protein KKH41_04600 [Candidatus Thermoplasmatota archaeon]|nr:hypothetical protein [Euryarchaeota archaeon]MBU4144037.1 hypothetical protein [Candidatus Thermoplasmatota archaeon]MBU4591849.1 hypothetical protein [Candidatus Thermoplasmatota archaeon]